MLIVPTAIIVVVHFVIAVQPIRYFILESSFVNSLFTEYGSGGQGEDGDEQERSHFQSHSKGILNRRTAFSVWNCFVL